MDDNTRWLAELFGDYDLLHLDPLLLDLVEPEATPGPGLVLWNQTREAVSGLSLWKKIEEAAPGLMFSKSTEEAEPRPYLNDLLAATGLSPGRPSLLEFFDSGGLLDRLRSDHELRREIVAQVEKAPEALAGSTSLSDVASALVVETGGDRKDVASAGQSASVVVVQDTILNKLDRLPPEMLKTLEIPYLDDGRRLGYVLSDRPFRLLSLDRPAVPLVVNGEAADRWTPEVEQFLAAGWYPYVLVLGRYRVTGGRPYIDALAVLAKQYPPIHQILLPRRGDETGHSLQEMLEKTGDMLKNPEGSIRETAFQGAIASEEGAADVRPPSSPADAVQEVDPYTMGLRLLYPLLMFGLCCEVNGVDLALLKSRAEPVYSAYQACVSRLVEQGAVWGQEGQASPLVDMVRQGRGKALPIFTADD